MRPLEDLPAGHIRRNGQSYASLSTQSMLNLEFDPAPAAKAVKVRGKSSSELKHSHTKRQDAHQGQYANESQCSLSSASSMKLKGATLSSPSHHCAPQLLQNHGPFPEHEGSLGMGETRGPSRRLCRRPHQTVNYYSRGITPSGRPRSPFAYPTRLKRVGYRPSSPAWIDINQAGQPAIFLLRPQSPLLPIPLDRVAEALRQQVIFANSPSMQYGLQAVHASTGLSEVYMCPLLPPEKKIYHVDEDRETEDPEIRGTRACSDLHKESGSDQVSPAFYDYSEAFLDCHVQDASMHSNALYPPQPQLSKIMIPNRHTTAELRDRRITMMPAAVAVSAPPLRRTKSLPCPFLGEVLLKEHLAVEGQSFACDSVCLRKDGETEASFRKAAENSQASEDVSDLATAKDPMDFLNTVEPAYLKDGSELLTPSESALEASIVLTQEIVATPNSPEQSDGSTVEQGQKPSCSRSNDSIASFESFESNESFSFDDACSQITITKKASPTQDLCLSEPSEIISPTPERSLLSSSNQHRFSKILDLNEECLMNETLLDGDSIHSNARLVEESQSSVSQSEMAAPAEVGESTEMQKPRPSVDAAACLSQYRAIVAVPPPSLPASLDLPFAFTPIKQSTALDVQSSSTRPEEVNMKSQPTTTSVPPSLMPANTATGKISRRGSVASSDTSRPWNTDSNYPWNDKSLDLEVALPPCKQLATPPVKRLPRFKLRALRASNSSLETQLLERSKSSLKDFSSSRSVFDTHLQQFHLSKSTSEQVPKNEPSNVKDSPMITAETSMMRPTYPPSKHEGCNVGAPDNDQFDHVAEPCRTQSFFSDDSSQKKSGRRLRMPFSKLRLRQLQLKSGEEPQGLNSQVAQFAQSNHRASSRRSHPSEAIAATKVQRASTRPRPENVFRTLKNLWRRGGSKIFVWKKSKDQLDHTMAYSGPNT